MSNPTEFEDKLQQRYLDVLKEMDGSGDLTQIWSEATNLEQQLVYGQYNNKYVFAKNNQYLSSQSPFDTAF